MTVTEPSPTTTEDARVPLSFNQEFLTLFDQGDEKGPFGPKYSIVYGWHVRGAVDPDTLREAMDLVVCRHEALRTVVVRGDEDKYQTVLPASPTKLRVVDLPGVAPADRAAAAEDLLIDLEQSDYPVADLPLFQAVLARFDDDESVLVLIAHHTAVDGWSMHLLIRDLTAFYAVLRGHELPDLPELTQYQEYVRWERERFAHERLAPSREYWATQLEGARILALPTDWRKSEGRPKSTAAHRFLVDEEVTAAAIELAKETRGSAFMVMLAAYEVFLSRRTGETDILVTTLASGRGQARFQETVGSFFNFVPLRTDLSGATTFREVVAKVRATCLKAYSHQVPFAQVMAGSPELGASFAADDAAVFAFQVFQFPYVLAGERVGDLELTEIRRRLRPQDSGPDIPDGALWTLDVDGSDMVGNLQYNTNIFRAETIAELVTGFLAVLRETVTDPDSPLGGNR